VLVYLRTDGRQKNKASKTANVENNSGIVYIDQRDQMRSGNKRTKTTITVLVIFIILFFIISILVGVFVSKPEFLYGTSTITYEINGVSHSKSVIYGKEYFIEIPTKVGHTFLGLYDKEENGIQVVNAKGECVKSWDSKTKNENRILFAKWKTNMYTFVYNGNGGAGLDLNNFECEYNEEMPTLASNISRMGYTFAGWSTKDAKLLSNSNGKLEKGKEKLIFPAYDIPLEGNEICLFAVWTAMDNTLIFMSNDGADRSESQIIKTDATTKLNANTFKRDGYNFAGWSTTATGDVEYINSANYTMGAVNATLFAVWTGEIVFNANGGLGEMANQNIKIDTTAPLSNNIFTRVGYSFVGWSTASNATEIAYKDGARYTITTGGATLYAKWEANDYIITFDTDGGNSIANIKAKYGALINLPKAIRYKYDTFAFWTNNSTEYVASITMPAKDILMTAKYNT
ncbi:MAG: InlB B-repeat-containing protein, partial [Clostridia bacterium]